LILVFLDALWAIGDSSSELDDDGIGSEKGTKQADKSSSSCLCWGFSYDVFVGYLVVAMRWIKNAANIHTRTVLVVLVLVERSSLVPPNATQAQSLVLQ